MINLKPPMTSRACEGSKGFSTMKTYYIYIITNYKRTVFYTGFTSNLSARIDMHKKGKVEGFAKKYHCKYLVYYEVTEDIGSAFEREKQIKSWGRKKKDDLVRLMNPKLRDLSEDL